MPVPDQGTLTVAVHNNLETFFKFLQRAEDPDIFQKRKYRGDRGLFWLGDPKLLFVTAASPGAKIVSQRWGYPGTEVLAPANPTHQLSLDILNEPKLVARIVDYAGPGRTLRLVPYATTVEFLQLAETLRTRYGLTILLPESPLPENLWLRDYVDTKAGFRDFVSRSIPGEDLFPPGFVCENIAQAARSVDWFFGRGEACVVKANSGESGIGHNIFSPGEVHPKTVLEILRQNPFLQNDIIIVERYITAPAYSSPSLELFVPAMGAGRPRATYVSQQLFSEFGRFAGVMISRSQEQASWYPLLYERGMKIAEALQGQGYVGHFDLDAVIDSHGHPYLLEINARRTGGTYVHEFARHTFGPDYLQHIVLLSQNAIRSAGITRVEDLLDCLSGLLFPDYAPQSGIVITVTSTLEAGEFGCICIATDEAKVLELNAALMECLAAYRQKVGKP